MLLASYRSWRTAGLALIVALWPALAAAQAQVEAVPEPPPPFDMWDLDNLQEPAIELPDDLAPAPPLSEAVEDGGPQAPGTADVNDPCRHFTEEERRLLPSLCGPTD